MDKVYPEHIYEPIRHEVATNYIKHELRKYLPSLKGSQNWVGIDRDIESWFSDAPYLYPVRDFWNGFDGILTGFKLYWGLCDLITAENIQWTKEKVPLADLHQGSLNQIFVNKGVTDTSVANLLEVARQMSSEERLEARELATSFYTSAEDRTIQPITVVQKRVGDKDQLTIWDGNGRATIAILDGRNQIEAYVGRYKDERRRPENFWVSTAFLFELTVRAKSAFKDRNEELFQSYVRTIKDVISWSKAGEYELVNRALPRGEEFQNSLLISLGLK